ncbi:MAG: class I SAM-dependent methyltransferase [Desulfobacteraceae bacterium]|nr:class I SAM-dependent methyltransferase [Desulfobacteraceae bacterium]
MMDTAFWKDAWEEARTSSSLYQTPVDPDKWRAFWDFFAPVYARRNREDREFHNRIVDHLVSRRVLRENDRVLDVGCGPGTYTLPLADHCRKVVGLDTAPVMLETMQGEAAREGMGHRIAVDNREWAAIPESPDYDVVFGALTPAIKDYACLMKMNRVSRRYCCLISFKGRYHSTLRDGLWRWIMDCDIHSMAFDTQFPFNILYHDGFLPDVAFFPYERTVVEDAAYVKQHFRRYFAIFTQNRGHCGERIDAFIDEHAENNRVQDFQHGVLGVISWPVGN